MAVGTTSGRVIEVSGRVGRTARSASAQQARTNAAVVYVSTASVCPAQAQLAQVLSHARAARIIVTIALSCHPTSHNSD